MKDNRRGYRNAALVTLARARPARLDAEADADGAQPARWPEPAQLVAAAELADERPADPAAGQGPPGRRSQPLVQSKVLAALASAALTAAVIAITMIAGTGRSAQVAPPGPVPAHSPVFSRLALGPHWHGRVAYAVRNGVVYLEGTATLDSQGDLPSPVVTLPRTARPAGVLDIVAVVNASAAKSSVGHVEIGADGRVRVVIARASVTSVSLDGVSFPVGSR